MSNETMSAKVKELRELKRMAAELAEEITSIEDEIKSTMSSMETDTLTGADWRITWKSVTTNRLDTTAFRKAMPELAERFTKSSTVRRFVLA